ncbi:MULTISPECIES: SGNH/GDSL hydrolase family protein [Actinoalloteichus]|uniref:Lysophospholipase L1-like esterase n=1 Tax=Actinoalloteichus fjordicus TaxID=1612552 RepID=A0AAC9LC19_9PSEU|nr:MULTISPECIES: SGNH/GDSL hydrolase family protein [Actinoalloteichus]APU14546.1 lysophospholipase L1-like esterase [Actinoalloteichus fjordicus]APU20514.1 lysophospholipase L1-like esterase [Actinoalloteichus sp. GBA129-24]
MRVVRTAALAAGTATAVLFGLVVAQGRRIREEIPRLPAADGPRRGRSPGAGPALRVAVLGDSTGAGVGLADIRDSLAPQLAEALAVRTGRDVHWRLAARPGATARQAHADLLPELDDAGWRPDLVVLSLGVNDVTALRPPAAWRRDTTALVSAVRHRFGAVPTLAAGLPPFSRFPTLPNPLRTMLAAYAALLDRIYAAVLQAANGRHVAVSPRLIDGAGFFASDGFHPSAVGVRKWAELLADAAVDRWAWATAPARQGGTTPARRSDATEAQKLKVQPNAGQPITESTANPTNNAIR